MPESVAAARPPAATPTPRRYPWRTAAALVLAATITGARARPDLFALARTAPHPPPIPHWPVPVLGLAMAARSLVFAGVATLAGFWFARALGLGAPYLEHRLDGAPRPSAPLSSIVKPAVTWAVVTAIVAFAVDAFFVRALGVTLPAPEIHARIDVAWWESLPPCLWAPFAEETFDRLFLLSLIAWIPIRLFRLSGAGRTAALWFANVATALIFGVYHIDNEAMFADPVPALVAWRTVLIILPVGLAFGWLYFRRGLEAAILSHFIIDVIVHVLRPLLTSLGR